MNRSLVLVAMITVAAAGCTDPEVREIGVLTFNIRFDNPDDGVDAWPNRKEWVADVVRSYDPDLISFQEALASQVAFLESALPGYVRLGQGRDDGLDGGEFSPVFFRSDRFRSLGHGMWWLSEHPDSVGSRGWDAALPRVATWVRLVDRSDTLVFVATHFDHRGATARTESAALLADRIGAMGTDAILAGDFNFTDTTTAYRSLVETGWTDAWAAAGRPGPAETFSSFTVGPADGDRIDYVFTRGRYAARDYSAGHFERDGRHPSDHRPVFVRLVR